MKESFPEPQSTIEQIVQDGTGTETIEDAKKELMSIALDTYECLPDSKQFSDGKDSFVKIRPIIESEINKYIYENEKQDLISELDRNFIQYFVLVNKFDLLTESDKEMAAKLFMISDSLDHPISGDILGKRKNYTSKEENLKSEERLADYILKKFNFTEDDARDLIQSWLSVEDDEMAHWYIYSNFKNVRKIENLRKGSAKYLYDNFGIRCFGRYEKDELIKQYDERDDKGPYGVFFQAVMDYSGAFAQSNQSELLREKVEDNSFLLRIIEANGKIDLAKRLLSLRDKYDQKIKFMYIHAHGNEDVIGLGDGKGSNRVFLQGDLKGTGVQRLKELFEDNAEVILSCCLTGAQDGLAQEISNVYNVKVIASDKVTAGELKSIDIQKNSSGDNLKFNVVFNTQDLETDKSNQMKKGTVIYGSGQ